MLPLGSVRAPYECRWNHHRRYCFVLAEGDTTCFAQLYLQGQGRACGGAKCSAKFATERQGTTIHRFMSTGSWDGFGMSLSWWANVLG